MPSERPSRRTVLQSLGVAGALGLSGVTLTSAGDGDASTAATGDWSQFHAGAGHAGATDEAGPTDDYLTARWEVDVRSLSNPAVVDGTVYVTKRGGTHAYDTATGELEWEHHLESATGFIDIYSTSSPAVADGTVFVTSDGGVAALDAATGEQQWLNGNGTRLSPAVAGGSVYAAAARSGEGTWTDVLFSFAASNGTEQWRFDPDGTITTAPAVADGTVIVGTESDIYAVDADSGDVQWQTSSDGPWATPAVAGDTVYLQGGGEAGESNVVAALDTATGDVRWTTEVGTVPDISTDVTLDNLSPAVADGTVFVLVGRSDEEEHSLAALDAATGEEQWRFGGDGRSVTSAPVVARDTLYVGGDGAESEYAIFALDTATGTEVSRFWSPLVPAVMSPSVVDETVFATMYQAVGESVMYAIEAGGEPPETPPEPELTVVEGTTDACDPVEFEVEFPDQRPGFPKANFVYRWDFEDDDGFETETRNPHGSASWSYAPGRHDVRVVVQNEYGATKEATTSVTVESCEEESTPSETETETPTDDDKAEGDCPT